MEQHKPTTFPENESHRTARIHRPRRSGGLFDRGAPMAPDAQALGTAEALTMPRVQVIVLDANMRCQECRERVSQVLSKMDNLLDYVVDVSQRKVTVRGRVDPKKRIRRLSDQKKRNSRPNFGKSAGSVAEEEKNPTNMVRCQNIVKTAFCFGGPAWRGH